MSIKYQVFWVNGKGKWLMVKFYLLQKKLLTLSS